MRPGEITNAGPVSASSVHPEPGPVEYVRSTNVDGSDDERNADGPPTPATANGTATPKPTSMTINCSVLTHAVPRVGGPSAFLSSSLPSTFVELTYSTGPGSG